MMNDDLKIRTLNPFLSILFLISLSMLIPLESMLLTPVFKISIQYNERDRLFCSKRQIFF